MKIYVPVIIAGDLVWRNGQRKCLSAKVSPRKVDHFNAELIWCHILASSVRLLSSYPYFDSDFWLFLLLVLAMGIKGFYLMTAEITGKDGKIPI